MFEDITKPGYDGSFELDPFGNPRLISEIEMMKNIVMFVLFSKPGQYPSLPDIGMDIESLLYSFFDEIDVTDLRNKIVAQCNALGWYFERGNINIRKVKYRGKPSLMIHIEGTEELPEDITTSNKLERYQIGLTYNDLNQLIYNVAKTQGAGI